MNRELQISNEFNHEKEYQNTSRIFTSIDHLGTGEQNPEYIDFISGADAQNYGAEGSNDMAEKEFWNNIDSSHEMQMKAKFLRKSLAVIVKKHPEIEGGLVGQGLCQGIICGVEGLASEICVVALEKGLLIRTCGRDNEIIRITPQYGENIYGLEKGLEILRDSINDDRIQLMIRQYNTERMQSLAAY